MPGYFGAQRFTYYRLRTESHNTVLIDGQNQDSKAAAPLTMRDGAVEIDLARAYPGKVMGFTRTVSLKDGKTALFRDDIEASRPIEALWGMVTDAQITVDRNRATLEKGSASLRAEILSPEDAVFDVVSANAPAPQNPNQGARKLVIRLPGRVTRARIEVRVAVH
jgi:hypothetical protein